MTIDSISTLTEIGATATVVGAPLVPLIMAISAMACLIAVALIERFAAHKGWGEVLTLGIVLGVLTALGYTRFKNPRPQGKGFSTMTHFRVYADPAALAEAAAAHFLDQAAQALAKQARFAVALSGGTTPQAAYQRLARPDFVRRVDWPRVHVFWGDERCVPPDHADSDYRMAREALLDHIPLSPPNIHRLRGELEPCQAAAAYEQDLRACFGETLPRFDLMLLGLGEDGHTASLFPGTAALHENRHWVVANWVEKLHSWRLTLTPPVINHAVQVTFIVSGAHKAKILREVTAGSYQPDVWPAQLVRAEQVVWLADADAASLVNK
jgi:6-phosphogluconolactonase